VRAAALQGQVDDLFAGAAFWGRGGWAGAGHVSGSPETLWCIAP
jgi:hypothetical protein